MGGQDHCCVVNCTNRRSNLPKGYAFHRVPAKPIARRNAWIRATGRKIGKKKGELTVTENTKVCGAHFISGRKSDDPSNVDYIPTKNIPFLFDTPKRNTSNSQRANDYSNAVKTATSVKKKRLTKSGKVLFPVDVNDIAAEMEVSTESSVSEHVPMDTSDSASCSVPLDHDYHKFWVIPSVPSSTQTGTQTATIVTENTTQTVNNLSESCVQTEHISSSVGVQVDTFDVHSSNLTHIKVKHQQKLISELKSQVKELSQQNRKLQQQKFCVENLLVSDASAQFYTGLPNVTTFNALFSYLEPKAKRLTYWRGNETAQRTDVDKGPTRKHDLKNEFFAVLVRLKLGLLVEDISNRFDMSVAQFSKMFNTWIRFLHLELQLLFPYPSAEQVQKTMPDSFRKFPKTRMILDCTEIFIQKPSALKAQRETWSSYKHRNTLKSLIGITPDGTVSYVSDLYGGAASDRFIVNNCGVLDLIEEGDNIMADRGFEISEELNKKGATLNIPPFRNGNFQLSSEQVETTRRIAEVRIHVERAIQRIKTFHILDGTLPLSLQIVANDIFRTCALLTNFQTPIMKC